MKLGVFDRLMILNNLPAEGNLTTIKIVRELREALSFTEDEHAMLNFVTEDGVVRWSGPQDYEVEIPIGAKGSEMIRKAFEALSKEEKLTVQHLSVCEKFGVTE